MNIALLGMGTIGSGVVEIAESLPNIKIKRILDKIITRPDMTCRMEDISEDTSINLVVETMGGLHPAYEYAKMSLLSGKHFVTANKLLVATYGEELSALAREKNLAFLYSAACGGGIPFLMNLQKAHEFDTVTSLGGILNGTTNFILDAMQRKNLSYADALAEAQSLGYAEKDPTSDVEGLDTMRKVILACAVGFGKILQPEAISTFGISRVLTSDIAWARQNGLILRLCAAASNENGLSACVEPTFVDAFAPESAILSNVNYAWYRGKFSGLMSYTGQGAGKLPTATNVIRDILRISAGEKYMCPALCEKVKSAPCSLLHSYYIRVPQGVSLPEGWADKPLSQADFSAFITVPLPVHTVHSWVENIPQAFIAGIQKG